jgi:phenylacetate-CoA ligase
MSIIGSEDRINLLLRHAAETTQFYAKFRDKERLLLADFPVMNKTEYNKQYDDFLSSTYRRAKDNRVMRTSGSTGTPFQIVQNRDKINRNTASALYIGSLGGYRIGDRQAFARSWVNGYRKSRLRRVMENLYPVDSNKTDPADLARVNKLIKKKRITSIIGYASYLEILGDYLYARKSNKTKYSCKSILAISEHLPDSARRRLVELFDCPVNAQYSNEENGVMGIQQGGEEYYLDSSSWYFEILKSDSDEPVQDGQLGRIVITDLYNFAFPIIRYDTGDMAVAKHIYDHEQGRYWMYLVDLYGRKCDMVFDPSGRPVSPHLISTLMHDYAVKDASILQWQFVQLEQERYLLRIASSGGFDQDMLRAKFSDIFGENIEIDLVNEIPELASGKRKAVQNAMLATNPQS